MFRRHEAVVCGVSLAGLCFLLWLPAWERRLPTIIIIIIIVYHHQVLLERYKSTAQGILFLRMRGQDHAEGIV